MTEKFYYNHSFVLESGIVMPSFHLAYTTLGSINEEGDNVVWIFHALTANSNPLEWWSGLVGEGKLFDPAMYFIVCVNMPGSCYGSIAPTDINEATGKQWLHQFPQFTIKDMVNCYRHLKTYLKLKNVFIGLGGSMGGQQLLQWSVDEPELFQNIVLLATNAKHSAWGMAFNATQRFCIEADASWKEEHEHAGMNGLKNARAVAMLSYRNYGSYQNMQTGWHGEPHMAVGSRSKAETYQEYQGQKLARRFNAFSYYFLSRSMDLHDVGRGEESVEMALKKIKAKSLVIGISSDILFPVSEQDELAKHIPGAVLQVIDSLYGHDGFLLEYEKIEMAIRAFAPLKQKQDFVNV